MDDTPMRSTWLAPAMTEAALATIAVGVVGLIVAKPLGLTEDVQTTIAGVVLLVATLTVFYVPRQLRRWSDELGRQYMRQRTGITGCFHSLEASKSAMQADCAKASNISLLLQIGRRELGDSETSYFYSLLADGKSTKGANVRILRAAEDSPFLSQSRAMHRKSNVHRWHVDLRRLSSEIGLLKQSSHARIEERFHHEPFLWRIFIFDDVAYVSGYLYSSNNDSQAVVYRLESGRDSMFAVYKKYFDYLWLKYDVETVGADVRWSKWD